jgi:hypothetical protein
MASSAELDKFMEEMSERMKNTRFGNAIEYPVEVSGIKILDGRGYRDSEVGSWVSVRPCAKEYEDKTFLGIYLGDLLTGGTEMYNVQSKQVEVMLNSNPAIYVPDLKKIVWGMESWWGVIDSPEKLRKISNADIENVWYVRALKDLSEGK